uniref:Uncharacterized protein n=1 Tax=Sphaeramia orbicularis TaxID=375764 RepID=A0A673AMA9_9TELE
MTQLATQVSQLTRTQAAAAAVSGENQATSPPVRDSAEPNIPAPSKYTGNPDTCRDFFTQLQLIFDSQPVRFSKDSVRIAYVPLILGYPWLQMHEPFIDWGTGEVYSWGKNCETRCKFIKLPECSPKMPQISVAPVSVPMEEDKDF